MDSKDEVGVQSQKNEHFPTLEIRVKVYELRILKDMSPKSENEHFSTLEIRVKI